MTLVLIGISALFLENLTFKNRGDEGALGIHWKPSSFWTLKTWQSAPLVTWVVTWWLSHIISRCGIQKPAMLISILAKRTGVSSERLNVYKVFGVGWQLLNVENENKTTFQTKTLHEMLITKEIWHVNVSWTWCSLFLFKPLLILKVTARILLYNTKVQAPKSHRKPSTKKPTATKARKIDGTDFLGR